MPFFVQEEYVPPASVRVAGQSKQPLLPPLPIEEKTKEAASRIPTRSLSPPSDLKVKLIWKGNLKGDML